MKKTLFTLLLLLAASITNAQDFRFIDLGDGTVMLSYRIYVDEQGNVHRIENSYGGDIVIPETVDGKPVSRIAELTFDKCVGLTSITIPATVDTIAAAFYGCTSLRKIVIADGTKPLKLQGSPGNYWGMFDTYYNHLNSLEEVYIGRNIVTGGGHSAFCNEVIKTITMGPYVTRLEDEAFRGCKGLNAIALGPNLTFIGRQAFHDCESLPAISIPDGVATIGEEAFQYCRALESIKMPAALQLILRNTFAYCNSLKEIDIPAAVDSIAGAFYDCYSLRKLNIEDNAKPLKLEGSTGNYWGVFDTYYNHLNSLEEVYIGRNIITAGGHSAFCNENIKTVTMGDYVTRLEDEAFRGCKGLNAIALSPNLTFIGRLAFRDCESLPAISIPDGVTTIGEEAFQYCRALESIKMPAALQLILYNTFANCNSLKEISIPAAVDSIAGAFYDCYSLRKLKIEDNAKPLKLDGSVGNYWGVFDTYYNHLNSLEEVYQGRDLITAGGHSAFSNEHIKTLTMSEYVTTLQEESFRYCRGLRSVTISPNLTSIGRQAFHQCDSLPTISLPDGVTTIGEEAFQYCRALESIKMPATLQLILRNTFAYCNSLKEIDIPAAVDSIAGAFYDCYSLRKLNIEDNAKPLKLDGSTGNYWGVFDTYYNHLNSLEEVYQGRDLVTAGGHSAFSNEHIKTLTMSEYVTTLQEESFRYCRGLRSVTVSPNLTSIGRQAFNQCDSLPAISLPDGVVTIGDEAFNYCCALESIKMPSALKLIQTNTFAYCNSLQEIVIPAAVDSIGSGVFYDCRSLAKVTIEDSDKPLKLNGSSGSYWGLFDTYYNHVNSLKEVYVGRNLDVTGHHCPFYNENIETLTLGHLVTDISGEDYAYCNPTSLHSLASVPPTCASPNVFKNIDKLSCALYVPEGSVDAYKSAFVWSEFFNIESSIGYVEIDMTEDRGDGEPEVIQRYTLDGRAGGQERGLNIIRMSDGTVRKVLVK